MFKHSSDSICARLPSVHCVIWFFDRLSPVFVCLFLFSSFGFYFFFFLYFSFTVFLFFLCLSFFLVSISRRFARSGESFGSVLRILLFFTRYICTNELIVGHGCVCTYFRPAPKTSSIVFPCSADRSISSIGEHEEENANWRASCIIIACPNTLNGRSPYFVSSLQIWACWTLWWAW